MPDADGKQRRALVLDVHSSAGLETLQSLGRRGVLVDVASTRNDCLAFHSRYAGRKLLQAGPGTSEFSGWIHGLHNENPYDLIVPAAEVSLVSLMSLDPGDAVRTRAVLPRNDVLQIALDKTRTWSLASELGIPVPHASVYSSPDDLGDEPAYPVVLKPARSRIFAGRAILEFTPAIVNNRQEWTAAMERWLPYTPVQQQTYVAGYGVGIELLFNRGKKAWHFAHERLHEYPLTGGGSCYRRSIQPDPRMLAAAEKLLAALDWHGVAMVEFKVTRDGRFHFLEINPRMWGSLALALDAGVDFPMGLLLLACGKELPPQPNYKVPYYTRNLALDIAWQKRNIQADHRNSQLLTRNRMFSLLEYLRVLSGRESWDHFDIHDARITYRIVRDVFLTTAGVAWLSVRNRLLKRRLAYLHHRLVRHASRPRRILFICYGNICRSPVAEYLARTRLLNVQVDSAGLDEAEGRHCPRKIVDAAARLGLDLSMFRSCSLSERQVRGAELILVMDIDNYVALIKRFPEARPRTTALGMFSRWPIVSIEDPDGASEERTAQVVDQIDGAITGLNQWLEERT